MVLADSDMANGTSIGIRVLSTAGMRKSGWKKIWNDGSESSGVQR